LAECELAHVLAAALGVGWNPHSVHRGKPMKLPISLLPLAIFAGGAVGAEVTVKND
jgi:hypothetical protein